MDEKTIDKNLELIRKQMVPAAYEAKHTGDRTYVKQLRKYYDAIANRKNEMAKARAAANSKLVQKAGDVAQANVERPAKSPAEEEEEKRKQEAERKKQEEEAKRKKEEEDKKRLEAEAERKKALVIAEAKIKAMEAIRKQEQNYETILEKMVKDPSKVTAKELKSLGDDVKNLKQEAENRISQLPREERELKLSLIRGDKISEKSFSEIKETSIGLQGNLQAYIEEVNKIPVGSVMAI
jgi:hypothetical protein